MAFSKNSKIFYSTTYGIYVSNDSGLNWDLLLIHSGILDIAVSPDGYLYFRDSTYILYRSKQQIAK